jgi:hypothetical protein
MISLLLLVAFDDQHNILPNLISLRITTSCLHQMLKPPAAAQVVYCLGLDGVFAKVVRVAYKQLFTFCVAPGFDSVCTATHYNTHHKHKPLFIWQEQHLVLPQARLA